jgi:glycosyltransferase involved in cell wall biosynthesis
MKLLIISHTSHYRDSNGAIKGWGPTIREINFLATKFEEIIHVATLHNEAPPESSIAYSESNIHFIAIPPSGGKSISAKIKSLLLIPEILKTIGKASKNIDAIQLRVPTGMANYLLPWFTIKKLNKMLWVKYAGNWKQINSPLGYQFQKWWLNNNFLNCKVTINGKWEDQLAHCLTFENPCLDEPERLIGKNIIENKRYEAPFTACFIGRIEVEKGVQRILEALPEFAVKKITTIYFIGEGNEREDFQNQAAAQKLVNCVFLGSVERNKIPEYLIKSHFLLLPSTASEGFPKVIAEGANYGALPIVSDVSSIGQYINETNGFVWDRNTDFTEYVRNFSVQTETLSQKSREGWNTSDAFTFKNYYHKLLTLVLNDH